MEECIATRVKTLRTHYNLSVKEFAHKCNLSHVAIFQLEKGKTIKPHKGTLLKLAKLFGVNIDWLLYGKGEMLPNGALNLFDFEAKAEHVWREEAYQEIKQKNFLLEKEIERLWHLLEAFTKQENNNFKNVRILSR